MKRYQKILVSVFSIIFVIVVTVLPSFASPILLDNQSSWLDYVHSTQSHMNDIDATDRAFIYYSVDRFVAWKGYKNYYGSVSYSNSGLNIDVGQKWVTRPVTGHIDTVSQSTWLTFAYGVHLDINGTGVNGNPDNFHYNMYGDFQYQVVPISGGGYTISLLLVNEYSAGDWNSFKFSADWNLVNGVPTLSNRVFQKINSRGNAYTLCVPSVDDYLLQINFSNGLSSDIYFQYLYGILMSYNDTEILRYTLSYDEWLATLSVLNNNWQDGYDSGDTNGYNDGFDVGYSRGYQDGVETADIGTLPEAINAAVTAPVTALTSMLDFEILGINMLGFLGGILAVCLVVIIIKLVKK